MVGKPNEIKSMIENIMKLEKMAGKVIKLKKWLKNH